MPVRDLTGIQTRTDSRGEERFRGYVKERGKKVWGPWGTYADARAWRLRSQATLLEGGSLTQDQGDTIRGASDAFIKGARAGVILSRKRTRYAPKTIRGYEQAFRMWINPELGHIRVGALRRDQVQRWVDWVHSQRADGTTRNTWAALAALYRWLLPRHHELADPTDGIELPAPSKPRERYAEPEEMAALLAALPHDLALPYALAFYAGLRHAEIQAFKWEDVQDGWITIRRAFDPEVGFKPPKSGKERSVPVLDALAPYLTGTEGWVFPAKRVSKWGVQMLGDSYKQKCDKAWTAADLQPIGLHEARHSFVTALVHAGYDIKTVQEWAGHADPSTTLRIYAKARGRQVGLAGRMNDHLIGAR